MRARYGSSPVHLLVHVLAFALVAWTVMQLFGVGGRFTILVWFVGAVVFHDALLWPLYAVADRAGRGIGRLAARSGDDGEAGASRPSVVNFVRVPVALSGVLLLVYSPLILGRGDAALERVSGLDPAGYGLRWLIVSAVLLAGSALLYALRVRRTSTASAPASA